MRLIDADELKEVVYKMIRLDSVWVSCAEVIRAIDNAVTVEPEVKKVPIANVTFDTEKLKELTDEIVERIKRGEIVLQDERPKGEWNCTGKCSVCGEFSEDTGNYCSNCGAEMREVVDNETN